MTNSLIIHKTFNFNTSTQQLWDLLTNPKWTKQYMFGCEVLSDWTIGSPIIWKGKTESGSDIIHVKGEITDINSGKMVSFSMFDPNMGIADRPENYVHLTYQVNSTNEGSKLTIKQDFTGVEDAQKRHDESATGWDMVADLMKQLVEKK